MTPIPDMKLQLVPISVADVERAKAFYEKIGFGNDHDVQVSETMRVVQFTPPGSVCSIVFGTGMGPLTDMKPGSLKGLHLAVEDIETARDNSPVLKHGASKVLHLFIVVPMKLTLQPCLHLRRFGFARGVD